MKLTLFAAISAVLMLADTAAAQGQPYRLVPTRAPMTVNCGAYRRPVVRYVTVRGFREERVSCVSNAYSVRPARRVAYHRSWQKSALVIGGSTAAGAGVGALVGGKKGALVGAVVGAGAGTVYEVNKRHHHRRYYYRRRR